MTTVIHAQSLGPPFQIYGAHARRRKTSHFQQRQSHNQSRPVREDAAVVKTALASIASAYLTAATCPKDDIRGEGPTVHTSQRNGPQLLRRVHNPRKESQITTGSWRTLPCGPPGVRTVWHPQGNGDTKRPAGKRARASDTGGSNISSDSHKHTGLSVTGKRRWESAGDKNGESDDEDSWNRRKQTRQLSSSSPKPTKPEFACPFDKYNPSKNAGCGRRSWPNTARVKQHLFRVHKQPIHCSRCFQIFDLDEELQHHSRTASGCEVRQQPPHIEGIDHIQEKRLKSRRGLHGKSEEEKWKDMYRCLFPDADVIPSPYVGSTPGEYENFVKRELPRVLRDALEQELNESFIGLLSELQLSIPGIVDRVMQGLRLSQEQPNSPNAVIEQTSSETLASDDHIHNPAEPRGLISPTRVDHICLGPSIRPWTPPPYRDTGPLARGFQFEGFTAPRLAVSGAEHNLLSSWDLVDNLYRGSDAELHLPSALTIDYSVSPRCNCTAGDMFSPVMIDESERANGESAE